MQTNNIESILEGCKNKNNLSKAYFAAIKQLYLLHILKRKVKSIRLSHRLSHESIKYITENFPKIEQCMADNARELFALKNVRSSRLVPVYLKAFSRYIDTLEAPFDASFLFCLFERANAALPCPTLEDSSAFPLYMKAVLCEKICLFYTSDNARGDSYLQMLFLCLDEAIVFDREDSLATNPSEMVLLKDEVYRNSTDYTKESFRRNLSRFSKKAKKTQLEYANGIYRNKDNFTGVLADKPFGGQVYILLHIFLSVLFTFFLTRFYPVLVLSFIPVYRCVKLILDRFFTRFVLKGFTEPALRLCEIPDGKGVLVTVTTLLTGKDKELFSRLEAMYCGNKGKNVYFSLLCDLCDSKTQVSSEDRETVKFAGQSILALRKKYGDVFFLFIRDREFSKGEGKYVAPERKRGAVNALCRFLCGKSDGFNDSSIKPSQDICENIKYVFTLDADTNLALDSVRQAAGIMLHPQNMPVYDEKSGRVVKGFGILQPKMSASLTTAGKSFFTSVMCGGGGVDSYSTAGYNHAFALFGKGVFCGKGMFDKDCFYKALCSQNEFAKGTVLSHDAPEGALLRCASTSHITLTDGFPREQMSYNKRRHRWIRGDIQNLHFFLKTRKNAWGKQVTNGVDFVSKYLMFENIADALLQIFSFVLLVLSTLYKDGAYDSVLVSTAVACYILPFIHTLFSSLRRAFFYNLSRLFYSRGVYAAIWTAFFRMLFDLSAISQNAYLCADAVIRALYRHFVSHRFNLEWTTAAQSDSESRDGLPGYVKKNLFSAFAGTLLITAGTNSFVKLLGLLWMALPVTAYYCGRASKEEENPIPAVTRNALLENLGDMWQFFEDNVSEKTLFLPPDNVSFRKGEKVSPMTSPTNIGLYLASAAVAYKSGLISKADFEGHISNTVCTLEKLPKYGGLLYNWYNIYTSEPLEPKFVSSVDEGNYIACLYVVLGALEKDELKTELEKELRQRIKALIDEADYSLMYNLKRKLFYIGFTVEKDGSVTYGKNCYDMLMSETRTLSYTAIAQKKVSVDHGGRLGRPLISSERYVGIASWSGTVFEYFMPCLFLPSYKNSFTDEALKFALSMNIRCAVRHNGTRLFGVSESCFNEIDDSGNYMYKAFGTAKLAMCVFRQQGVISPYSSYLMLESAPGAVLDNLLKLRLLGLYGKYGFYESCDFERHEKGEGFGIVRCFMSHHVGMSICALGNFLFDGYVRKCFMNDVYNKSARELLEEKIPDEVYIKNRARKYYKNLSKPVMRPEVRECVNPDKASAVQKKEKEKEKEKHSDVISISLYDGKEKILSEKCRHDGFGKITSKSEKRYRLTMFDAIREPMRITVFDAFSCDKISLRAQADGAATVMTEAGGVVFYMRDKMYFLYGFYLDAGGERHQGVCFSDNDRKTGSITFDIPLGQQSGKYVLALGRAKSFDAIYNCEKRLLSGLEGMMAVAQKFYLDCTVDSVRIKNESGIIPSEYLVQESLSPLKLPIGNYDIEKTAMMALKLMYTECTLKKYVCLRLCEKLYGNIADSKKATMLICRVFCAYGNGLDDASLTGFLDGNAESYRLVIKSLYDTRAQGASEKKMYKSCLLSLEALCTRAHDDAARRIVSQRLDAFKD